MEPESLKLREVFRLTYQGGNEMGLKIFLGQKLEGFHC